MPGSAPYSPDPKRFEVSKSTLWFDRIMGWLIRFGGVAVILAVFGIFFFIIKEVLPLFQSADVEPAGQVEIGAKPLVLGVDEWGEIPFFYEGGSSVTFVNIEGGERQEIEIPGLEGAEITAHAFDAVHHRVVLGLADGRVGSFLVEYERQFEEGGKSWSKPGIQPEAWFEVEAGEGPVTEVSYGDADTFRLLVAKRGTGAEATVSVLKLQMKRGLIGAGKLRLVGQSEISGELSAPPALVRASQNGSMVLVVCENGDIDYFAREGLELFKRQTFHPFEKEIPRQLDFLYGGVSVVMTSDKGHQQQWSLFRKDGEGDRLFGMTQEFPDINPGRVVFATSLRNRSFVTGANKQLSIRYSTSGSVRWEKEVDFNPVATAIDAKSEHLFVATDQGEIRRYTIDDPHPEAGWRAFFGKVWYEGGSGPVYQWQSTGGSDDFEPKLSQMPLIFGSLKGTAYALLFSVPIALLAAVFSASFLPLAVKRVIKPTMEIMASIPSVVLGFVGALWFAPILYPRVPSFILVVTLVPVGVLLAGFLWSRLPVRTRNLMEGGREWMAVLPVIALMAWLGWILGPVVESWLFIVKDPETGRALLNPHTGKPIADFTMWWPQWSGASSFEQRNCMALGFVMGFAVIPVIFTIAEDAMSNVPKSLTAASSALGANRWQVVWTIILPVASSGIFSALMIGFGRAVGETMILLMMCGNTPIMEWNIFNGMRPLAPNIAVELPEAAEGSTHYRTLFLGAVLLFLLTSVMNTLAELLRQRLRDRNRLV